METIEHFGKPLPAVLQVKHGLGVVEYTQDQLRSELNDLSFLRDAFLLLLDPEVETWDVPFDRKTTIRFARDMYYETSNGWSREMIDSVFDKHIK